MKGITETPQYKAWKFPGGEIHFKLSEELEIQLDKHYFKPIYIQTRLSTMDDTMLLALMVDCITRNWDIKVYVNTGYMPYMQADREFSIREPFGAKVMANILNSLPIESITMYDCHSDVMPALLNNCYNEPNDTFIEHVIKEIGSETLTLVSPDAGAYKKIFKLADSIKFGGGIISSNKYRDTKDGSIQIQLSTTDLEGRDVLIVDDICIGGRTFLELAKKLKECNVGKLHLAVTHGIFSNGFGELAIYFDRIFTTNTRQEKYSSDIVTVYKVI